MGTEPYFCVIRFFGTPQGWAAEFTQDPIARRFPSFDTLAHGHA
jgi:cupin superfamily acireductone dioxygenase involved in methionine salvage